MKELKESKESKKIIFISPSELVEGGMYFTSNRELIKVTKINSEKREMDIFNLTEQIKYYGVKLDKHKMIKRVR